MAVFIKYLAIAFLVYWVYRRFSRFLHGQAKREQSSPHQEPQTAQPPPSAYDILGVSPGADADEIKAAYRKKISEYHPDKVAHLGDELQRLAKLKSEEINQAYRELV